jgi:nicotinate-nucleotide adenylyltransferase
MVVNEGHSNSPRRMLVFGGTFDPPHKAHAVLPAQAAEQLQCDLILYIPAAINPLKTDEPHASGEQRLAMLLLAIADVPNARISTIELDRAGPSYTIDTLGALHEECRRAEHAQTAATTVVTSPSPHAPSHKPETSPEFHLLIGCDQALDFHRWKDWREILKIAMPAVMLRPPWNVDSFRHALRQKYREQEAQQWMNWTLRLPLMDISATQVREKIKAGDEGSLREILDPAVIEYIQKNRLYR